MKINKPIRNKVTSLNSLLIDGEYLLKQGFHGAKHTQGKHGSVGTIYHFVNTIKRFYQDYAVTKVVVFWEGEGSKEYRKGYYPYYKMNRNDKYDDGERFDLDRQRIRIKQYLEELSIRQVEIHGCEADDSIAYYTMNSPNENKVVYTNDRDLLQLLSDDTKVQLTINKARVMINKDNFKSYFDYHYDNVGIIKMIAGDTSDNISGLKNIGEQTVLKYFPEIKNRPVNHEWIMNRTRELLEEKPNDKTLNTIINGDTKWGTYGNDYFSVMNKIINLREPNITEELKSSVNEMVNEVLSPEGRGGIKKVMEMMKEDELLNFLPRNDDNFFVFWSSFITIIKKEENAYNTTKKRD
jgi:5'-3' exonuclease